MQTSFGLEDFELFTIYFGQEDFLRLRFLNEIEIFEQFERGPPKKHSCEIILNLFIGL